MSLIKYILFGIIIFIPVLSNAQEKATVNDLRLEDTIHLLENRENQIIKLMELIVAERAYWKDYVAGLNKDK
jgi:energy-converting hydrogenase Eha subunit H